MKQIDGEWMKSFSFTPIRETNTNNRSNPFFAINHKHTYTHTTVMKCIWIPNIDDTNYCGVFCLKRDRKDTYTLESNMVGVSKIIIKKNNICINLDSYAFQQQQTDKKKCKTTYIVTSSECDCNQTICCEIA